MDIVVCIKQVPAASNVEVDEKTGVLKREGIETKMNPYDLYALECALRIAKEHGGTVSVISMGPLQARSVIREAYMMGADTGYLLSDTAFAGSDVLATSFALSQGIRAIGGVSLIVCGKQTTDGDTAQVGPAIAEYLSIPHAAWVTQIVSVDETGIEVRQTLADRIQTARLGFPCLITVEKDIAQPRLPSYLKKKETSGRLVQVLTLQDLPDRDASKYGLEGSPTQVEKVFPPGSNIHREVWRGDKELADRLYGLLKEKKHL